VGSPNQTGLNGFGEVAERARETERVCVRDGESEKDAAREGQMEKAGGSFRTPIVQGTPCCKPTNHQPFDKNSPELPILHTASLQFRWLAQLRLHGLFIGEVLVFLLFKGKLIKHANYRTRLGAA